MSITINYNNSTIATLENRKATALKCSGKLMADDITVNVAIPEYDGETVKLISFTVDGDSYQAEEGMTWEQFIESEYNDGQFGLDADGVTFGDESEHVMITNDYAQPTEAIIADNAYEVSSV